MNMTNSEYNNYIKSMAPGSPVVKDMVMAFIVGGLICCLGQGLSMVYSQVAGLGEEDAATAVSMTLIFLSAILTGLNIYDKIAQFAGAGTLVPITGFANSVVSPALEYKPEGMILGVASKLFQIAGPVITFGISASVVYGLILCLLQ